MARRLLDLLKLLEVAHGLLGPEYPCSEFAAWYKLGLNAEEIVERMGNLTLAQVYAALTYYHANQAEIESYLATEKADYDRHATEMESSA